jgi:hypothetical protein
MELVFEMALQCIAVCHDPGFHAGHHEKNLVIVVGGWNRWAEHLMIPIT